MLGAGINGVAIARELLLNDVSVCLVDMADTASGTTSYSSRLIHGGLRYLEYAEFSLVRESLAERDRLLKLAPHLVKPLRLYIPVASRSSGLLQSIWRFLGGRTSRPRPRGLWVVRLGLRFYDWFAKVSELPQSGVHRIDDATVPHLNPTRYRWLCSYYDAQVRFPERMVLAMLHDARRIAASRGSDFQLVTYAEVQRHGRRFDVDIVDGVADDESLRIEPTAVINATGPWGDRALREIDIDAPRLMGRTKGSHLVTFQPALCRELDGRGVYAEAKDGRPVFILPFGPGALVGTTDIPFEGDPGEAVAEAAEMEYLVDAVNQILPQVQLEPADIDQHYCGVRPLPFVDASNPAATTRKHSIVVQENEALRTYTIVGGKLTTCRSLAEEVTRRVLHDHDLPIVQTSADLEYAGVPDGGDARGEFFSRFEKDGWLGEQLGAVWELFGGLSGEVMEACPPDRRGLVIEGTCLPRCLVAWCCRHEHARCLADLVERRLMLLFCPNLSRATLVDVGHCLADCGMLLPGRIESEVDSYCRRLAARFGKRLSDA